MPFHRPYSGRRMSRKGAICSHPTEETPCIIITGSRMQLGPSFLTQSFTQGMFPEVQRSEMTDLIIQVPITVGSPGSHLFGHPSAPQMSCHSHNKGHIGPIYWNPEDASKAIYAGIAVSISDSPTSCLGCPFHLTVSCFWFSWIPSSVPASVPCSLA